MARSTARRRASRANKSGPEETDELAQPSAMVVSSPAPLPSVANRDRSAAAIRTHQLANRRAGTPPVDFCSRVLKPLEVRQTLDEAEALLEPGVIVQGAGEAVPALGHDETDGRRDDMVDTLERPTTISVRASEHRLELLDGLGLLQAGVDTACTAQARTAIEKMLAHQLAASHAAVMNLLRDMPGLQGHAARYRQLPLPWKLRGLATPRRASWRHFRLVARRCRR